MQYHNSPMLMGPAIPVMQDGGDLGLPTRWILNVGHGLFMPEDITCSLEVNNDDLIYKLGVTTQAGIYVVTNASTGDYAAYPAYNAHRPEDEDLFNSRQPFIFLDTERPDFGEPGPPYPTIEETIRVSGQEVLPTDAEEDGTWILFSNFYFDTDGDIYRTWSDGSGTGELVGSGRWLRRY